MHAQDLPHPTASNPQRHCIPIARLAAFLSKHLPEELANGCDWETVEWLQNPPRNKGSSKETLFAVRYLGQRILIRVMIGQPLQVTSLRDWIQYVANEQPSSMIAEEIPVACYPVVID
jgi:hypothetical protein